jgi:iron complex transport system substrate-binding protein
MKPRLYCLIVFFFIIKVFISCTDRSEEKKQPPAEPRRIVSLAPSITEVLYALGAGDQVVGVTDYCRYPPEARKKPSIGGFMNPNLELVVTMRPDLVATIREQGEIRARLARIGLPAVTVSDRNIEGISEGFAILGRAVGKEKEGLVLRQHFLDELNKTRLRFEKKKNKRVLLVVGRSPGTLKGMYVAGTNNYFTELLEVVNATNIFDDVDVPYLQTSFTEIYARNPEVIIELKMDSHLDADELKAARAEWNQLRQVEAVARGEVYLLNDPYYTVPGMSLLKLLSEFARIME